MSDVEDLEPHLRRFYVRFLHRFNTAVAARVALPVAHHLAWTETLLEISLTEQEKMKMWTIINAERRDER